LVQVLDGKVEIKIDGVPHEVVAGEMMLLPAEHPHALRALSEFKMLLTMVRQEPEPLQVLAF
jgi:quercetin dioxygenase-like cupin family protein